MYKNLISILFFVNNVYSNIIRRDNNIFDEKYIENAGNYIKNEVLGNNVTTTVHSDTEKIYNEIWFYIVIGTGLLLLCCVLCFIRKCCC